MMAFHVFCTSNRLFARLRSFTGEIRSSNFIFRCLAKSVSGQTIQPVDKKLLWLLTIPVTTTCLGTWQIFRLRDKLELKLLLEARTQALPVPMPANASELDDMEYQRVILHGIFDHRTEFYVRPRQLLSQESRQRIKTSEKGAQVITPFYCKETNTRILVNRGWVPESKLNPASRQEGQVEGEVTITAVVRGNEKRPVFMPKNNIENNFWYYKDLDQMSSLAGTEPILVDADASEA
jgi:surfeit locus 1 family protein